jgi:hypothetical protein
MGNSDFNRSYRNCRKVFIMAYSKKSKKASKKSKGSKICPAGKAWAERTFDTYPSAYANMAASKYCKDPNYAKGAKGKKSG